MQENITQKLFEMIVGPVLYDKECPYRLMKNRLSDIDIEYFEEIPVLSDKLDDSLCMEVKRRIMNDFIGFGNQLIEDNSVKIAQKVKRDINEWLAYQTDRKQALKQLDDAFLQIHNFTRKHLNYVPTPSFTKMELREMYEAAMKGTLIERVTGRNKKDVIRYYHALISHTVWACRMLTRRRASQYLMQLVDELSREYDINSPWGTHFDDESAHQHSGDYHPVPADTSNVELSEDMMQLAERMAENVHDVWAATRLAQGWTYGPERNDSAKKHPCLVPYDQLPEKEKVYDRNTSIETLRFIISNGFEIRKME